MRKVLTALASVALLAAPLAAQAQGRSHGGGGGGFHGGGAAHASSGVRGGGFGGGYRGAGYGGYRGGGYGGYGGYGYGWGAAALGFGLGAALAYPGYYDGYDAYGYDAYGYGPDVGYDVPAYAPAPAVANGPAACGQWVWDQGAARYSWVPGAC